MAQQTQRQWSAAAAAIAAGRLAVELFGALAEGEESVAVWAGAGTVELRW